MTIHRFELVTDNQYPLNGEKAAATAVRPVESSDSGTLEECSLEHAGDRE